VAAGLLFAALHLPLAGRLVGLSAPVVAYTLVGGEWIGVIFGWVYWRKGLIAAMMTHATQDFITKGIFPLIFS
jgi:membrane protease YdiL (CAAX protease family)